MMEQLEKRLLIQLILLFCWNTELNSKQYEAQQKQLQFMMEMACFNALFDILKFQDVSTVIFKFGF